MVQQNEEEDVHMQQEQTSHEDILEIENAIKAFLAEDDTSKVGERDEELEEYAQRFKVTYENQFVDYLKTLTRNSSVNVTSLPIKTYSKATFDQDCMNDSTTLVFYFDSVELNDDGASLKHVNAYSFDRAQKCTFKPYLYRKYGMFHGTTLLCGVFNFERQRRASATAVETNSEYYFLDLPVFLYKQID